MRFPFVDEDDPYIEEEISYYVSKIEDEESEMVRRMKEKERKKQLEMETEMEFLSSDEDPAIEDDDDPPIGKEVSYILFMTNLNSFLQPTAMVGDEESEMRRRMNEKEREKQLEAETKMEFFWFDDDKEEGEPETSSVLDPSLKQAQGQEVVYGELPLADDDKEEGEPEPSSVLDPSLEQAKGKEVVYGELPLADDDKEGEPGPSSVLDPSLEQAKGKEVVYGELPLADDDKEGEPGPSSVLDPSLEQAKGKEVVYGELPLADDDKEGEPGPSSVLDPSLEQAKGKEVVYGELTLADDDKEEGEPDPSSVLDPSLEQAKGKEVVYGELTLTDDDKEEGEPEPSSVLDPSLEQAKGKEVVYDELPLANDKGEGEPEPSSVLAPSVEQAKGKEVVHDELPLADDDKEEGELEPSSALDPSVKQAKGKEVVYNELPLADDDKEGEPEPSSVLEPSVKHAKGKEVVADELPLAVGGDSWAASALLGLRNCYDPMIGFLAEEAKKMPCLGDKEPVSALAADFPSDCSIIQEKIKLLGREYSSFRRARRDGNCFYRSFIFSYLEQVVGMQDDSEVYRILGILNQFRQTNQRKTVNTFDDFYSDFTDLMVNIMEWKQTSTSFGHEQLLQKSRGENYSSNMLAFFRLITSFEICARAEHYKPFLPNMKSKTMEEFCRAEVIPMAVEADHVQIIALAYALKVPMRVVEIDSTSTLSGSGSIEVNQQDLLSSDNSNTRNTETSDHGLRSIPQLISSCTVEVNNEASSSNSSGQQVPFVTLLYRPGHYDILYPK